MTLLKNSKDFWGLTLQASINVAAKNNNIKIIKKNSQVPFASSNSPIVR